MATSYTRKSISEGLAQKMVKAAAAEARKIGVPMCIAVCDESAVLKAFLRMDRAALLSIEVAINKAKTAAGFSKPTGEWWGAVKDDPALAAGVPHIKDMVVFGGGFPVRQGEQTIGAIGVSGGSVEQDCRCAEAALALVR